MTRGNRKSLLVASGAVALVWFLAGGARAQTPSPAAQDCADFSTQEEAQAFYDQHKDDQPNDPDPFDLDTDGDGKACEGLPASAQASPGASPTASPGAANELPNNGAEAGVLALSGLTFVELGYGLTLASRRLGIRKRAVPLYLLQKFVRATSRGERHVEIADDVYLVHRSVLERSAEADLEYFKSLAPDADDAVVVDQPATESPPNLYAALARPGAVPRRGE